MTKLTFDEIIANDSLLALEVKQPSIKDTGRAGSIISIFLSLIPMVNIFGLWLADKSYQQSKYEGHHTYLGVLAVTLNVITVTSMIAGFFVLLFLVINNPYDVCSHQGAGTWLYNGETIICN